MTPVLLPLFRRFPHLAERFPRLPLCELPTPVHRLEQAGPALGLPDLWIKRDDRTHAEHGGNKVRKLEFCLGEALARQAGVILTAGATGSNWAAACLHFALEQRLPARFILYERPLSARGEANLRYVLTHAEHVRRIPAFALPWHRWRELRENRDRRPTWIPTGGTSVLSSLGFVSAALELAEQVERGELPRPDTVVATLGTGGMLGGLLAGFQLAGMPVELVGVRVVDRIIANARAVRRMASRCLSLLGQEPAVPDACRLRVYHRAFGPGYALPTEEAEEALRLMQSTEGIALDTTYTAKCVAGLRRLAAEGVFRGRRALYWHSLNPKEPGSANEPHASFH